MRRKRVRSSAPGWPPGPADSCFFEIGPKVEDFWIQLRFTAVWPPEQAALLNFYHSARFFRPPSTKMMAVAENEEPRTKNQEQKMPVSRAARRPAFVWRVLRVMLSGNT
jgi:hypothetical protein